jgi:hypothetical protein
VLQLVRKHYRNRLHTDATGVIQLVVICSYHLRKCCLPERAEASLVLQGQTGLIEMHHASFDEAAAASKAAAVRSQVGPVILEHKVIEMH